MRKLHGRQKKMEKRRKAFHQGLLPYMALCTHELGGITKKNKMNRT